MPMQRLLESTVIDGQLDREIGYTRAGVAKYHRLAHDAVSRNQGANLKPVERLLGHWFFDYAKAISQEKTAITKGIPGNDRNAYGPYLGALTSSEMAVVAMKELVNLLLAKGPSKMATASYAVGCAINAEINVRPIRKARADAWAAMMKKSRRNLRKEHIQTVAVQFDEGERWPIHITTKVGACLIWLLVGAASSAPHDKEFVKSFNVYKKVVGKKTPTMINLSEDAREVIDSGHSIRQYLRPRYGPMEVKPLPWTEYGRGGYYKLRTSLVKHTWGRNADHIKKCDLGKVFEAVNALGATPWRVNTPIYEVVDREWQDGGGYLGIPLSDDPPKPIRPDLADTNEEVAKIWKTDAIRWYRKVAELRSVRMEFIQRLGMAKEWTAMPKMYFPHQLDFTGRSYPINLYLNHHGDDVSRGMLTFAKGKPLGENGLEWIKVHTATCFGIDKVPFDERIVWVDDSMGDILKSARDPLGQEYWRKADKPFQFLAACIELLNIGSQKNIENYRSSLPVQMDGSCNALQHYCAITRDEDGAPLVNMVHSERPEDFYKKVLDLTVGRVEADIEKNHPIALMLDGKVVRKTIKQPVMTKFYNVTRHGAIDQIKEQIEHFIPFEQTYKVASYIAKHVSDSMVGACPKAIEAMDWLTDVAKVVAGADRQLQWISPLGLACKQPYTKSKTKQIQTVVHDLSININDTKHVRKQKQINGFPPNIIHSYDAAHCLSTAIGMHRNGHDFAAVHDGFWTQGGSVDHMHNILREEFVSLHKDPLLKVLHKSLCKEHPDLSIPEPPEPGKFDIKQVLRADYAFS